jgi:hypothetical protein
MKPILSIWIKPLKTFDYLTQLEDERNNININIIFFLVSMTAGFSSANDIHRLFEGNYFVALFFGLLLSGLFGLLFLNTLFTYSIWGISKLFQGKADKNQIRLVIAYSLIPNLIHLIVGLILIVPALITNNFELVSYQNPITVFVLWIFMLRILLFGLAFFNKYSYGYALLTIVIPSAIIQGILYWIKFANE